VTYNSIPAGTPNWDVPVNQAFIDQDSRITTNEASIMNTNNRVTALENRQAPGPAGQGFIAWSSDPAFVAGGSGAVFGTVYMQKIVLQNSQSIANIVMFVNTAPTTLTAGQNFAAIFDSAGNRIAITADQSTAWATTGLKTMPLSGGPQVLPAGTYYVAHVGNGTGTLGFWRTTNAVINGDAINVNLTASNYRASVGATAQTSMPATITMASRTVNPLIFWYALS
jgi:hypothetical protein